MSRIGPEKSYCREVAGLSEWINNGDGTGLMGLYTKEDIPRECVSFILSQYARFNISFPEEIFDVAYAGAWATYTVLDVYDPYAWLCGLSDIDSSDDWCQYTYEIQDH